MGTILDRCDEFNRKEMEAHLYSEYTKIMTNEAKLTDDKWDILPAEEAFYTVEQIQGFARSSTVIRSYHGQYNLTTAPMAFESDGAHTNLMAAMVDRALSYLYGPEVNYTADGYNYRMIMEAIRRHDLPENITGDTPDDGTRDEAAKIQFEQGFQREFSSYSPSREVDFEKKVLHLLAEMEGKTSPTGKLLYIADKTSAVIMALCYDSVGLSPHRCLGDLATTKKDRQAIKICEWQRGRINHRGRLQTFYDVSEMWTVDYFKLRHLVQYDETGFFTALLVMLTLKVHAHWFQWRRDDYPNDHCS